MADVAKRMVGPTNLAVAAATVYTCGAPTAGIVRNIHVANTTAAAQTFNLSVGADATGTRLYSSVTVPANGTFDNACFIVVNPGEVLQAFASATGLTLTISGVEY